jgi:restriction endonuclease S subunit
VPYLRVANVQRGHIDLSVIKEIDAADSEIGELQLQSGDILLNEGGDIDKLGRGWVWEGQIATCIHQNHVFRARPLAEIANPYRKGPDLAEADRCQVHSPFSIASARQKRAHSAHERMG